MYGLIPVTGYALILHKDSGRKVKIRKTKIMIFIKIIIFVYFFVAFKYNRSFFVKKLDT